MTIEKNEKADLIPIERGIDRKNKKLENLKAGINEIVEKLRKEKVFHIAQLEHPHVANKDYIDLLHGQIKMIDETIEVAQGYLLKADDTEIDLLKRKLNYIKRRQKEHDKE